MNRVIPSGSKQPDLRNSGIRGTLQLARTGTAAQQVAAGVGIYDAVGAAVAFTQSSYNLATGQFTAADTLGFLPAVGFAAGYARNLRLFSSIDDAVPRKSAFSRHSVDATEPRTVRVTQFYDPKRGSFGPRATDALTTPPNRGRARIADGPWFGTPTPRTHVSPFAASEQNWRTRLLTGRGSYRNYVEFDVLASDLQRIGGLKGVFGIGRYQQFVPGTVSLAGANASFGTLGPNYGQWIFFAGLGVGGGAAVYGVVNND